MYNQTTKQFVFSYETAYEAVFFCIQNGVKEDHLIEKIIYVADKFHLEKYGKPITGTTYRKGYYPYSNEIRSIIDIFRAYKNRKDGSNMTGLPKKRITYNHLPDSGKKILVQVITMLKFNIDQFILNHVDTVDITGEVLTVNEIVYFLPNKKEVIQHLNTIYN